MKKKAKTNGKSKPNGDLSIKLKLYVAGQTPKSLAALSNLKRICSAHLRGKYSVEVIDLIKSPQLAEGDQILAIPTLVRDLPRPIRKIIGDLSNIERVLICLDVGERDAAGPPTARAVGAKA